MGIDRQEFDYVCELVRAKSGLVLEAGKEYLVEARLRPLAQRAGVASVGEFIQKLRSSPHSPAHQLLVEAMTINETSFFRDNQPFVSLREIVLPVLLERRRAEQRLVIWSAACATGQEAYTTAMTLREYFPQLATWECRILASDISNEVLARARTGRYSQVEVNRGLPAAFLIKYFTRNKLNWELNENIRKMVEFFEINLTQPLPALPRMDIIFLRNVLIYFDIQTKRQILEAARRQLRPDGYMLLGGSETTFGIHDGFERVTSDNTGWHRPKP